MFAEGRNLHTEMAARITGVPLDQVTKDQRDTTKAVNFGSIYGLAFHRSARGKCVRRLQRRDDRGAEAQAALDTFFRTYPTLPPLDVLALRSLPDPRLCRDRLRPAHAVEAAWGPGWAFPLHPRLATCRYRALPPIACSGAIAAHFHQRLHGIRARLCATVHDELLVEAAEADAASARQILEATMVEAFELTFPGAPTAKVVELKIRGELGGSEMIVGIDPGLSGALFFIDPHDPTNGESVDLPVHMLARGGKQKRELDIIQLISVLALRRLTHAFVEQVGAMPGQGVSGVFAFGKAYGIILGVVAARSIPLTLVSPARWKRALRRAKGEGCGACSRFAITATGCASMAVAPA